MSPDRGVRAAAPGAEGREQSRCGPAPAGRRTPPRRRRGGPVRFSPGGAGSGFGRPLLPGPVGTGPRDPRPAREPVPGAAAPRGTGGAAGPGPGGGAGGAREPAGSDTKAAGLGGRPAPRPGPPPLALPGTKAARVPASRGRHRRAPSGGDRGWVPPQGLGRGTARLSGSASGPQLGSAGLRRGLGARCVVRLRLCSGGEGAGVPGGVKCAGGAAAPPDGIALSFKTARQARPPELTSDTETLPEKAGRCRSRTWRSAQPPVRSESPLATLSFSDSPAASPLPGARRAFSGDLPPASLSPAPWAFLCLLGALQRGDLAGCEKVLGASLS